MRVVATKITGLSPLSFSRFHGIPKLPKENDDNYGDRTWRERCHYDRESGELYLPPMMLKNALTNAAKYSGEKIKGKGQKTWAAKFKAGVLVLEGPTIGVKIADVVPESLFLPSDGVAGSGKRVMKIYPRIDKWSALVTWHVIDDEITESIFAKTIEECGNFIGLGRFRPANNGYYGRFAVESIKWS